MTSWSIVKLRSAAVTFVCLALVFVPVAILVETVMSRGQGRITIDFMLMAALVIAIQVFVGNSGILSFGHVAFYGIAAYIAALAVMAPSAKERLTPDLPGFLMNMEWGLFGALGLAIVVVLIFATATGVPLARMATSAAPMATLAILVLVYSVINVSTGWTRGPTGISGIPDLVGTWTVLATVLAITALALLYRASPWGLKLQAVREDEVAAASLGINTAQMKLIGWLVSAGLMAVGGAVWALNSVAFDSSRFFFADTFSLLTMLVIGGIGSVSGAVLGAAIVSILAEVLRNLETGFAIGSIEIPEIPGIFQIMQAVLIIIILAWKPRGLLGDREFGELKLGAKS